jgi:hypothetical protein
MSRRGSRKKKLQNNASRKETSFDNSKKPAVYESEIVSTDKSAANPNHSNEPQHSAEERHRQAEGDYWVRQLRLSSCLNRITAAGTIVALIGLFFVWLTLISNEDATFQANRAWLAATSVNFSFNAPYAGWIINIKNYGRDPATNVNFSTPIITWPVLHDDQEHMETIDWPDDDTCQHVNRKKRGILIFPDSLGYKELTTIKARVEDKPLLQGILNGTRGNLVIGCVSYSTFSRIKYTQYCFLGKKMPDGTIAYTICDEGPYSD